MIQNPEEYHQLVEQKMQARAERHAREQEAQAAERVQEAQATQVALAQAQQAQQLRADMIRQREAAAEVSAEARRNRPTLIAKYKSDPTGLRYVLTLRKVCLRCGSEHIRSRSDHTPHVLVCQECFTEWFVSHCWSCATGLVDSRDSETPPCQQCGWPKCAGCGACNPKGCSTNPYHTGHRQRDEATA